jgi:hypothetical protein
MLLTLEQVAQLKKVQRGTVLHAIRVGYLKPYDRVQPFRRDARDLIVFEEDQVAQYLRRKRGRQIKQDHSLTKC